MSKINGQTYDFGVYLDGYNFLGIASAKPPLIKFLDKEIEGTGTMGKIIAAALGQTDNLELEVVFNSLCAESFKLLDLNGKLLEFKVAQTAFDTGTHALEQHGVRMAVRGSCSEFGPGEIKKQELMTTPFKINCTYIEFWMAGSDVSVYKIDKLNGIFESFGKQMITKLADMF